jgi:hypothetical protein
MAEEKEDWLFPDANAQKTDLAAKGLAFAQQYLVFVRDPNAAALLARWVTEIENKDVAPGATHAEYAYWEGRRAFVRGIQRQIDLATNGQRPIRMT